MIKIFNFPAMSANVINMLRSCMFNTKCKFKLHDKPLLQPQFREL